MMDVCRRLATWTILSAAMLSSTSVAQPLYQQAPFDSIRLTEAQGGKTYRIFPLEETTADPTSDNPLVVRLVDQPDELYEIDRKHIIQIRPFPETLLNEAKRLTAARQFEEAFDTFRYLARNHPQLPGLRRSLSSFLFRDAAAKYTAKNYEAALAVLDQLAAAGNSEAKRAIQRVAASAFERAIKEEDYSKARYLVGFVKTRNGVESVEQWESQLKQLAERHVGDARKLATEAKFAAARSQLDLALAIVPAYPPALELSSELLREYPRVVVGVTRAAPTADSHYHDWARKRLARLTDRHAVECIGYGDDGGRFICPLGVVQSDENGRALRLSNLETKKWNITLAEFERLFRAPGSDVAPFAPSLRERTPYEVQILADQSVQLRPERALLRWMPLFEVSLAGATGSNSIRPFAPYPAESPNTKVFRSNSDYAESESVTLAEIAEQHFASMAEMTQALRENRIEVIDRLLPAAAEALKADPKIVVGDYEFVSLFCLVPNQQRPLPADRMFRRGVLLSIDRQRILNQLAGNNRNGCEVATGPFPSGRSENAPIRYGFNDEVVARAYDPDLGRALMALARHNHQVRMNEQSDTEAGAAEGEVQQFQPQGPVKPLIFVGPNDAVIAEALVSLTQGLKRIGIASQIRWLPEGAVRPDGEWDFWMVDWAAQEPLLDIYQLMGADGITQPSPYVQQPLADLQFITRWSDARRLLREIHELVNGELAILPLWQITNHYAHRQEVDGIQGRLVTLYQDVERWRIDVR